MVQSTAVTEKQAAKLATKVLTGEFRISYPQVFEPKGFNGGTPKYSIVMLFDKKSDLSGLKKAALTAMIDEFGPKEKWPKKFRLPFRDGDEEKPGVDGYEGCIFISASSIDKPGVVDAKFITGPDGKPTTDEITKADGRLYAGCYARATLRAYGYDTAGNKGVSFGLLNIQKLRDGKPFSGRMAPVQEFTSIDDAPEAEGSLDGGTEDDGGLGDFG